MRKLWRRIRLAVRRWLLRRWTAVGTVVVMDTLTETWTIHGMRYADQVFRMWGEDGLPVGATFQIVKREDGAMALKEVR